VVRGADPPPDQAWSTARRELEDAIRTDLKMYYLDPKPFVWTKSADDILESVAAYTQRISDSED
jgi:hypothetical protein